MAEMDKYFCYVATKLSFQVRTFAFADFAASSEALQCHD